MKRLVLFVTMIFCVSFLYAQGSIDVKRCINGPATVVQNAPPVQFTAEPDACFNCYYWEVTSGNATIQGSNTTQTIDVSATQTGSVTLSMTYFKDGVCRTCTRTFTVDAEPACVFEPDFRTKFDCSPEGLGQVYLENTDLSEVAQVTYYFETNNNIYNGQHWYNGFQFAGAPGNGLGIVVTQAPFSASMSYQPGRCRPDDIITLSVTIEFVPGSDCEDIYEVYDIEVLDGGGRQPNVMVYPNPVGDQMNIQLTNLEEKQLSLQLYGLNGALLKEYQVTPTNAENRQLALPLPENFQHIGFLKVFADGLLIDTKKVIR